MGVEGSGGVAINQHGVQVTVWCLQRVLVSVLCRINDVCLAIHPACPHTPAHPTLASHNASLLWPRPPRRDRLWLRRLTEVGRE